MLIQARPDKRGNLKTTTINDDWFTDVTSRSSQANEYAAYHSVSYCYRAIDIRARTVSTMPYEWSDPNHMVARALDPVLPGLLWLIEASLSVYGAAYVRNNVNRFGVPKPRWLLPTTITPRYEPHKGLVWFDRTSVYDGKQSYEQIPLNEITYLWYPNLFSEVGSGVSPTRVALHAANVLIGLDEFSAQYFNRGAIKAVLLQAGSNDPLQGTPPKEELDRLRIWWRNLVQGVRNAFNSVVVSTQINPVVIGDGLQELDESKVIGTRIEDISVAYGVPLSLMLPRAATYATAQQDYINLYTTTTIPECELIFDLLNSQLLAPYGLTLKAMPQNTEVMAYAETLRAEGLAQLVERGILTLNEARERIGLEPLDDTAQPIEFTQALLESGAFGINDIRSSYGLNPVDTAEDDRYRQFNRVFSALRAAKEAGMSLQQAADYIGVSLPQPPAPPTPSQPQPLPSLADPTPGNSDQGGGDDAEMQALRSLYADVERLYLNNLAIDSTLIRELQLLNQASEDTNEQTTKNDGTPDGTSDDTTAQTYP